MIKSIYNRYLFYNSSSFGIVKIQTDDILILANNNFASTEKDTIRSVKIITKDKEYLTLTHPLKFNDTQIKLDLNKIVLVKESYIKEILLFTNHVVESTSSREISRKKLLFKE